MPPDSGDTAIANGSGVRKGDLVAGHYRVERVLGSGGMGVVVAARDERSGDAVAVKLLRSVDDTRAVERFFREARAMGRLDSKHVVRVRDAGLDGRKPYLVMDRLDGIDLSERASRGGPLDVKEAAGYLLQACEALSHAHSKGIVHRDVKPSNLFLHTEGGETILKVLDFGISKVQSSDVWEPTLTATDDGGVLGSPPYMSPEQVRDPKAVDARTDVWSLGVVLYKILSGGVPFDGESVGEVFAKVLEKPYPALRDTTDVPVELDAIVERCLAKDRDDRFSHVGELALALAPFASPEHAALAPRIAQRMHDEGPTLERPSSAPEAMPRGGRDRDRGEPSTMSLSGPPPEARQSAPPPAAYPELTPRPVRPSAPPPTGSVSMDVVPASPSRARIAILLGVIGVAAGIAIGVAMRSGPSVATRTVAEPAVVAPATPSVAVSAEPATSTSTSTSTSAAPPASGVAAAGGASATKAGRPRGVGTRKPGPGAPPGRPELQPSPYPTAP